MVRLRRLALAFLVGGLGAVQAGAQTPPAPTPPAVPPAEAPLFPPIPTDPAHPDYHPGAHRTILRQNPVPPRKTYRTHPTQSSEGSAGYSNPGGVGRYAEFYDPNTLNANVDRHANPVARFDSGGGPDRSEQLAAQQVGNQKARNIQDHIDTYGRPIGFGYGMGFGGGFGYAIPY